MAVSDSPRLGLTRWSAGTDPLTRTQVDGDNAALDDLVAIDRQGTHAARPAAGSATGLRGTYWGCTDHNLVYRSDGTSWITVGSPLSNDLPSNGPRAAGTAASASRSDHSHGPTSSKGFAMTMMGA